MVVRKDDLKATVGTYYVIKGGDYQVTVERYADDEVTPFLALSYKGKPPIKIIRFKPADIMLSMNRDEGIWIRYYKKRIERNGSLRYISIIAPNGATVESGQAKYYLSFQEKGLSSKVS